MAVGILGACSIPRIVGHVALARAALDRLGLERLLVLVVSDPGHKVATTPAETRFELTRLAFADVPEVTVELDAHARTVDSPRHGSSRTPYSSWVAMSLSASRAGSDRSASSSSSVWQWRRGPASPTSEFERRALFFQHPTGSSSSRCARFRLLLEIRERVALGDSIDGLVPPRVASEIARLGLYASAE